MIGILAYGTTALRRPLHGLAENGNSFRVAVIAETNFLEMLPRWSTENTIVYDRNLIEVMLTDAAAPLSPRRPGRIEKH